MRLFTLTLCLLGLFVGGANAQQQVVLRTHAFGME